MNGLREKRAKIGHHDGPQTMINKYGIDVFLGQARFVDQNTLSVNGKEIKFAKCIIASGGRPRIPQIPGLEKIKYFTSENIFEISQLPKNLVIVGGGPIGSELGQAFSRMGSNVKMLVRSGTFLPKEDYDVGPLMKSVFEEEGIEFVSNFTFSEIRPQASEIQTEKGQLPTHEIVLKIGDNQRTLECDAL
jgi:pyruvate/2-oxoglutarate dehydrogenase complex dihydrolipoamide dehydrogenase (E3) component